MIGVNIQVVIGHIHTDRNKIVCRWIPIMEEYTSLVIVILDNQSRP